MTAWQPQRGERVVADAREIVAQADRHRQQAENAELARVKIRLGEIPVARRGLLGFRKQSDAEREVVFSGPETAAIYEALGSVRREHLAAAERLEARLSVTDTDPTWEAK